MGSIFRQAHFQPIVELATRKIFAYEALSRDAEGGVDAADYFGRFEPVNLLGPVKELSFRKQLRRASDLGITRLFVNVDFELLARLYGKIKRPAGMEVTLEISEREPLENLEERLKMAEAWRQEGFQFACDDLGAGFLSLPFFIRLRPEFIKFDLSVVQQAMTSPQLQAFLHEATRLLLGFSRGLIAEGIETSAQLSFVKELGIPLGQGFLLGRPQSRLAQPSL